MRMVGAAILSVLLATACPVSAQTLSEKLTLIVPEPGSLLALATGVIGLVGLAIRRKVIR